MQVDHPVVEGGRAGAQVQLPHADELLVEHGPHLLLVGPEVVRPAQQGAVVVVAQVFHVKHMEILLSQIVDHLPQAGNHAAGENIFLDRSPEYARASFP